MFIFEGAPAIPLGVITLFFLTDKPAKANWLTSAERDWLAATLKAEQEALPPRAHGSFMDAIRNPDVLWLSLIYILYITGGLGVAYFIPTMLKALPTGLTNTQVGLVSAIPYVVAAIAMNLWGRSSDLRKERVWHAAIALVLPTLAFFGMGAGLFNGPVALVAALCVVIGGAFAFNGPFWALPSQMLTGTAAAVGIAFINSIGNLGGFLGPFALGYLKDATGSPAVGFYLLGGCLGLSAALLFALKSRLDTSK
jgi:ACS family tartrate transporter-like MFS transporter